MTDFVTLIRVKAVESDGERWIEGYATTPQEDRVGDVVEPKGAKFSLPMPLLWQHKHDAPIGAVTHATVTEKGIRIRARLSVGVAKAEEIWTLVKDGVLTAVSIGFRILDQVPHGNRGYRITSWEWYELSVVSVPANPGALISVAKCMAIDAKELGAGNQRTLARIDQDYNAGISTKGGIDANAIASAAQAFALKWAAEYFKGTPQALAKMAGIVAGEAHSIARSTLVRMVDMERRIDALEGYVPADAEAFEELAKLMERVDQVEHEITERGFRYRGYWREGCAAKRNEAFTHNGSLFLAACDTGETPDSHSVDWHVIARKGRDGKDAT